MYADAPGDTVTKSYKEKFDEIDKCSSLKDDLLRAFQELHNICTALIMRGERRLDLVRKAKALSD